MLCSTMEIPYTVTPVAKARRSWKVTESMVERFDQTGALVGVYRYEVELPVERDQEDHDEDHRQRQRELINPDRPVVMTKAGAPAGCSSSTASPWWRCRRTPAEVVTAEVVVFCIGLLSAEMPGQADHAGEVDRHH